MIFSSHVVPLFLTVDEDFKDLPSAATPHLQLTHEVILCVHRAHGLSSILL